MAITETKNHCRMCKALDRFFLSVLFKGSTRISLPKFLNLLITLNFR